MDGRQQRNNIRQSAVVSPGGWAKWASWRDLTSKVLLVNKHWERKRHLVLCCVLLGWHYSFLEDGGSKLTHAAATGCHCKTMLAKSKVVRNQVKSGLISRRNKECCGFSNQMGNIKEKKNSSFCFSRVIPSVHITLSSSWFVPIYWLMVRFPFTCFQDYILRNSCVVLLSSVLLSASKMIGTIIIKKTFCFCFFFFLERCLFVVLIVAVAMVAQEQTNALCTGAFHNIWLAYSRFPL